MTIRFVDGAAGNDANDGLDNIGVGLATATWTEATFTLTQNGHGYTFATGDVIYISAGTGATPGLYEVASSTANDIVLVETSTLPNVGNASDFAAGDLATGDIASSDGPEATIQAAVTASIAGDYTYVRTTATYGEAITGGAVGTAGSPITYEGYTTSLGDHGVFTNDGTGTLGIGWVLSNFHIVKNARFTDFTSYGIRNAGADSITLIRIRCDNNGSHGCDLDNNINVYGCYFHDNGGFGLGCDNDMNATNCIFWGNASDGIAINGGKVINCLFVSNGGDAIAFALAGTLMVIGCTIDGDAKDTNTGIDFSSSFEARITCVNNLIYDCTLGIKSNVQSNRKAISFNNLLNNNTTDYDNFGTESGEVTSAPSFVNEGVDYTPGAASPAKNAGADFSTLPWSLTITGQQATIGSILHAGGGGGGLLMPNKRGGKQ